MPVARARMLPMLLGLAVVLELLVAGAVAFRGSPAAAAVRERVAPGEARERLRQVEALLGARSRALLARDRAGFLAGIDPRSTALLTRQGEVFDALAQVPLASWSYAVDAHREQRGSQELDAALDRRYGAWWAPEVTLRVGLAGIDRDPGETAQGLTFTRRAGRWLLAADDDFPHATQPSLWDEGPVSVVRGSSSLVLGHPAALPQLRRLAGEVDAAVPRVTAVWGPQWARTVALLVPQTPAELSALVPSRATLEPLAALAVALPVRGGAALGADRVYVNPAALGELSELGRRVVLTHEVTHVAARASTGPLTPDWLSEGLADHVGFLGTGVPVPEAAAELRDDVRAGRVPAQLPGDDAFRGDDPQLDQAYEEAWLAVELLCRRYGQDRVLALYRDLGAKRRGAPAAVVDAALRADLGSDTRSFTAAWQASLREQLA